LLPDKNHFRSKKQRIASFPYAEGQLRNEPPRRHQYDATEAIGLGVTSVPATALKHRKKYATCCVASKTLNLAERLHSCAPTSHLTTENSRQCLPQARSIDQTEFFSKHSKILAANQRGVYVSYAGRDVKLEKTCTEKLFIKHVVIVVSAS